jgi:hypothetical protein
VTPKRDCTYYIMSSEPTIILLDIPTATPGQAWRVAFYSEGSPLMVTHSQESKHMESEVSGKSGTAT